MIILRLMYVPSSKCSTPSSLCIVSVALPDLASITRCSDFVYIGARTKWFLNHHAYLPRDVEETKLQAMSDIARGIQ